ncbi:hypothetical protein F5882DRAFT_500109 [Hyaloscypha sp. PMI_1271]|nr:hypothetical protein F5882DRAFT_500109 [Hyaloscypha sp. PMI_1271]
MSWFVMKSQYTTYNPRRQDKTTRWLRRTTKNPYREGALPDDFEERTGSWIATALAAGLAAPILHCVRLGAIYTELEERLGVVSSTAVEAAALLRVKDHDNMSSVLKAIGLDEGQQKSIDVWRRFGWPTQGLKAQGVSVEENSSSAGSTLAELRVIATLARDFVSGIAERIS